MIIGIVGAGTMGAGIAQIAVEAGDEVVLHDVDPDALQRARARVREGLARRAARLDLDADTIDSWVEGRLERLRSAVTLDAVAAEAELVIEAVLEDLELKRTILRALDAAAAPDAILATNTSALSVASIAATTTRPDRVLGMHFFNPVPVLSLVELVVTALTAPVVADRAEAAMRAWGRTTVRCADTPGFIVNRVNRPFTIEALRALEREDATVEAIDAAVRAAGFPMGPFELMDLVGIDVNLAAATAIWEALGRPDDLRPSPIQARLVGEGRLGRKAGHGFYRYEDGRRVADESASDAGGRAGAARVVDRILAGIDREAEALARDGLAVAADIDLAMRLGAGHPMGPFERRDGGGRADPLRSGP